MAATKHHDYHLVDPDPWPIIGAAFAGALFGGMVMWFHANRYGPVVIGLGVAGVLLTILLGLLFTSIQAYEYAHAPFAFKGNIYGATFFMATGFHGFHVIVGTIFLSVCLLRALKGDFTPKQHFGFEAAAWYWHFVDVVWLFLFACIFVWGSAGVPFCERLWTGLT